ncbi:MAG: hypothetical protein AAB681_02130 [Patescibacteria group bacterium]
MENISNVLKLKDILQPQNGKPIAVFRTGKQYYAKLILVEGKPFAASTKAEADESEVLIKIKGFEKFQDKRKGPTGGLVLPEDHIKITKVNYYSAEGEFI